MMSKKLAEVCREVLKMNNGGATLAAMQNKIESHVGFELSCRNKADFLDLVNLYIEMGDRN
ncbi:hypothetical protein CPT_Solomon_046 [Klebsiella phage Solomon]|uniref:Uncharacterized protein n=1 Tax=Klebsiella phage Solomon TaxID=2767583 RepID=A0A873WVF0_9CAUD|nr:hypothetical protein CPT_Solomon_046 [Klebsiella phage Solomon]